MKKCRIDMYNETIKIYGIITFTELERIYMNVLKLQLDFIEIERKRKI